LKFVQIREIRVTKSLSFPAPFPFRVSSIKYLP
jgi:hypothetical protein